MRKRMLMIVLLASIVVAALFLLVGYDRGEARQMERQTIGGGGSYRTELVP